LLCGLSGSASAADVQKSVAKSVSAPSAAAPDLVGDVSFHGGYASIDGSGFGLFGCEGRFAMGMSGGWAIQGDVFGDSFFINGGGLTDFGLTGHLISRGMGGPSTSSLASGTGTGTTPPA